MAISEAHLGQLAADSIALATGFDLANISNNVMFQGFNRRNVLERIRVNGHLTECLGLAIIVSFRGTTAAKINNITIPGTAGNVQAFMAGNLAHYRYTRDPAQPTRITLSQMLQALNLYVYAVWTRLHLAGLLRPNGYINDHFRLHCSAFVSLPFTNVPISHEVIAYANWFASRLPHPNPAKTAQIIQMQIQSRGEYHDDEIAFLRGLGEPWFD